jgi:hypothetical protein
MVNKKPRDLNLWVLFLATAVEIIRCRKCCVVLISLILNLQVVRKWEELEACLLVEILELSIASVVEEVPCS